MKKLMIYVLAAALACGLVVSSGHAQAPPAWVQAPPFVPPPHIPDLRGCWKMVAIINLGTNNVATKTDYNPIYLEVTTQTGTRCYGTLYIPNKEYPIDGFINGTNVSAFSNSIVGSTTEEQHRYITATLTTDESGELVMYGMGIVSSSNNPSTGVFLNQLSTFKGTRPEGVEVCPP